MSNNEYINLGLPSGTLWKRENEGVMDMTEGEVGKIGSSAKLCFTENEIKMKFAASMLPTLAQFEEMLENTVSEAYAEGVVYRKSKINGNAISFVSMGEQSRYYIKDSVKMLCVSGCNFKIADGVVSDAWYVRLVKRIL